MRDKLMIETKFSIGQTVWCIRQVNFPYSDNFGEWIFKGHGKVQFINIKINGYGKTIKQTEIYHVGGGEKYRGENLFNTCEEAQEEAKRRNLL